MGIDQGRRSGDDRRESAVYCRCGSERRDDERRSSATAGSVCPRYAGRELWQEVWGATDEDASAE